MSAPSRQAAGRGGLVPQGSLAPGLSPARDGPRRRTGGAEGEKQAFGRRAFKCCVGSSKIIPFFVPFCHLKGVMLAGRVTAASVYESVLFPLSAGRRSPTGITMQRYRLLATGCMKTFLLISSRLHLLILVILKAKRQNAENLG